MPTVVILCWSFKIVGKTRARIMGLVRLIIVGVILAFILRSVDLERLVSTLQDIRLGPAVLALALTFAVPVLWAWRWKIVCQANGHDVAFRDHLSMQWLAGFAGQVLPDTIGLEAMRIWQHGQRVGDYAAATAGSLGDRAVGVLGLIVLVLATQPLRAWVPVTRAADHVMDGIALIAIAGIVGVTVFAALPRVPARLRRSRFIAVVVVVLDRIRFLFRSGGRLAVALLAGVLVHAVAVAAIGVWFLALGVQPGMSVVASVVPVVFMVMILPLSIGGWGLREGAFVFFFSAAGVSGAAALAVSILYGLSMIMAHLPGAVALMLNRIGLPQRLSLQKFCRNSTKRVLNR